MEIAHDVPWSVGARKSGLCSTIPSAESSCLIIAESPGSGAGASDLSAFGVGSRDELSVLLLDE